MPNITRYWSVSIQKSKDYHFGCFARWKWVFQRRNVRISQIFTNGICGCESTITAWARVFIFALRRGTWFSLKCLQFLSRFLGEFYIDFFNGNRSLKCKKTLTWMQTNTKRLGEYKSLQQKNSEKSSSPQPLSSQGHLAFHTASHCAKVWNFTPLS